MTREAPLPSGAPPELMLREREHAGKLVIDPCAHECAQLEPSMCARRASRDSRESSRGSPASRRAGVARGPRVSGRGVPPAP